MPQRTDAVNTVCLTRQPVLDHQGQVLGYELRLCNGTGDTSGTSDGIVAADVLSAALLEFNLTELTEGRLAFVRFTYEMLVGGVATLARPAQLAVELPETLPVDASVAHACEQLSGKGYAIGLEGYSPGGATDALLPYVRFVKVDMSRVPLSTLASLVTHLRPTGISLIATHVMHSEVAAAVTRAGCQLLQGSDFRLPANRTGTMAMPGHAARLQLLHGLSRDDLSVSDLERLVRHDATLCVRVLQAVHAAGAGMRREVDSLHEALMLLGVDRIRKWVLLWTLASMSRGGAQATISTALVRARWCELLSTVMTGQRTTGYFLLGLCSLLDTILDRPMSRIVRELPLSRATTLALLGEPCVATTVLQSIAAYEQGRWSDASGYGAGVGLPLSVLTTRYMEALRWVSAIEMTTPA